MGELGACGAPLALTVAAFSIHHGEEPCISGHSGAGNVFFSHCNLSCRFCQNWPISQLGHGGGHEPSDLASKLLRLERRGAHNIGLVTATVQLPSVLDGLAEARSRGLAIPIVWNSNGYESVQALELLEGVVDVYLPDLKYAEPRVAEEISGVPCYVEHARRAICEMHRQVGPLRLDSRGLAWRGLMVRHLVLPGGLSGTAEVLCWLAEQMGPELWLSLMNQYFPAYEVTGSLAGPLARRLGFEEWQAALDALDRAGIELGYVQEWGATRSGRS